MNGFWNATTKKGFNITTEQYKQLYDTQTEGSIGSTIASTYATIGNLFHCLDPKLCTTAELFEM